MEDFFTGTEVRISGRRATAILLVATLIAVGLLALRPEGTPLGDVAGASAADADRLGPSSLPPPYSLCDELPLVNPFIAWGDTRDYVAIPNGSFEAGLLGWTVKNGSPTIVQGLNPDGTSGSSLRLQGPTKVVSPPICLDETRPHGRLFFSKTDPKSTLDVRVAYPRVPKGKRASIKVARFGKGINPAEGWTPSPDIGTGLTGFKKKYVLADERGHRWFQFELKTSGKGVWQIDDLYVDPRARH